MIVQGKGPDDSDRAGPTCPSPQMAAASVQDAIMLFGDSITQLGWQDGGFGQQLTRTVSNFECILLLKVFRPLFAEIGCS